MEGNASLRIEGLVFGTSFSVVILGVSGANMAVDVAQGGTVSATSGAFAMAFCDATMINNAGTIASYRGSAILSCGIIDITHTGQIMAADVAIAINFPVARATTQNDGLVRGGMGQGSVFVRGDAVLVNSANTTIVNTGTIESLWQGHDGIALETDLSGQAGTVVIVNAGAQSGVPLVMASLPVSQPFTGSI